MKVRERGRTIVTVVVVSLSSRECCDILTSRVNLFSKSLDKPKDIDEKDKSHHKAAV